MASNHRAVPGPAKHLGRRLSFRAADCGRVLGIAEQVKSDASQASSCSQLLIRRSVLSLRSHRRPASIEFMPSAWHAYLITLTSLHDVANWLMTVAPAGLNSSHPFRIGPPSSTDAALPGSIADSGGTSRVGNPR